MTGFLYSGADLGGFGCDTTEDLMMRWLGFGIFTPLFRNHSALGTRQQELYQFERSEDFRHIIELRYALIPYIYSEFMKAVESDGMYIRPLAFGYRGDERCREIEDQLLVGESLMIAPVYEQNKTGRYVYLPEKMKLIRFRSFRDFDEEILEAGDHYIRAELNEIPVFIRPGHVLPLCKPARHVEELDRKDLTYLCFEADPASYELYED
jgi:alpha-glucosidase